MWVKGVSHVWSATGLVPLVGWASDYRKPWDPTLGGQSEIPWGLLELVWGSLAPHGGWNPLLLRLLGTHTLLGAMKELSTEWGPTGWI